MGEEHRPPKVDLDKAHVGRYVLLADAGNVMLPPDFIKHLEGGGKLAPHCMVCVEYGAYVFLYSSCRSFERAERGEPVVSKEEVDGRFKSGLIDLRGGK